MLFSCETKKDPKFINEGFIEYEAKAVDQSHPMAGLAPNKMTVKFKKNKFAAEMSTMGVFTTTFIADPVKKTLIQTVKVFDVKNACIENELEMKKSNDLYKLNFKPTKETKEIAGYHCKKMIATRADDPSVIFDVYYTEELDINNATFYTPYNSIKGMLMQYRMEKFGLEMVFTATNVKKEVIPDNTFDLPGFYKMISKKEMDEFFKSIQ